MSKYFPFPLQRGGVPIIRTEEQEANPSLVGAKSSDERFQHLKPNNDLVHLITAAGKATLSTEQTESMIQGQPIRLTPKYSFKYNLSFGERGAGGPKRHKVVEIDALPLDTQPYELSTLYKEVSEYLSGYDRLVDMQLIEESGKIMDLGDGLLYHKLDLAGLDVNNWFSETCDQVRFQFRDYGHDAAPFFQRRNVCGLEHLVAYAWYDPADKDPPPSEVGVEAEMARIKSISKTMGDDYALSVFRENTRKKEVDLRLPIRLSFYWDTTKTFAPPDLSGELRGEYESSYASIFRFHQTMVVYMRHQNDLIVRAEHGFLTRSDMANMIPGVTSEVIHPNPDDFKLVLRDYQARSLTWLIRQETDPFALKECVVSSRDGQQCIALESGELITSNRDQKLFGGILADNTGVGKTVTALALLKARPLDRSLIPDADLDAYGGGKFIVKATLVICPSNLVNQWEMEYHKCIANGGNVLKVTTIVQARRFTLEQIHEADLIIMSHSFLSNNNFFNQKNLLKVKYLALKYHRIIVDEFHELLDSMYTRKGDLRDTSRVYRIFSELDAYNKFGLSGTPNYHLVNNVSRTAKILNVHVPALDGYAALFKLNYVRRSVPDLQLPPAVYEQVEVLLKPVERAIYQSLGNNTRAALLLCSHFDMEQYEEARLSEPVTVLDDGEGNELLSVHDVAIKIQAGRKAAVERKTKELQYHKKKLAKMRDHEDRYTQYDFANETRTINSLSEEIVELNGEHAFFDNVLQILKNRSEQECHICLNEFGTEDTVALTRCGHIFCCPCIERSLKMKPMCPICRRPVAERSVYKVSAEDGEPEPEVPAAVPNPVPSGVSTTNPIIIDLSDDENKDPNSSTFNQVVPKETVEDNDAEDALLDQRFYGSKITRMAAYIKDLLCTDLNARILLFVQFTPLSKVVSGALRSLGIQNSFVFGNIFARNAAIDKFRSKQVRVIMLSAETSVTGLQLTEATHIILLHPFFFFDGQEDRAIAAEKQGVARAYRMGLDHELKVVRFVVKNSVEEELLQGRPALPI